MVLKNVSLENMLKRIKFQEAIAYDYIVPATYPGCPKLTEWLPPPNYEILPEEKDLLKNSDIWKQFLKDKYRTTLDGIIGILNKKGVFGIKDHTPGLMCLALENALCHGNQNNPELPVTLKAFKGKKGMVVRIRDSGIGFDYKSKIKSVKNLANKAYYLEDMHKRVGKNDKYFSRLGTGLWFFQLNPAIVSFENNGTTVNIMYKFSLWANIFRR
ncbi:MAG: hypothetical protein ABIB71_03250 [Candidatus Woesearchaeota archaeon]